MLCHRDYHSRNLMLHDGSLYIIDFQDARMGPDTYDLVSLLRDSYVDLTAAAGRRADRVFPGAQGRRPRRRSGEFRRRFDLMALQRNLKALGTFGYMTTSTRTTRFTFSTSRARSTYVKANLAKYPRFERLRACSSRGCEVRCSL